MEYRVITRNSIYTATDARELEFFNSINWLMLERGSLLMGIDYILSNDYVVVDIFINSRENNFVILAKIAE